jgi:hypothetical protein
MFDYMVDVDIGHRTSAVPKTWRDKQRVRDFSGWANPCQRSVANDRLIRKYGERLWTSGTPEPNITLESVAWRGCNIFEAPVP